MSSAIIPIPANERDFEEKCAVLFRDLLQDPNLKTVGSRGQGQRGLDLLGARNRDPRRPVGVQCKLKTKQNRLTEAEVRSEVKRALTVEPLLTEYYVVTSASDDTKLDMLAMTLRREQADLGREIDIQVWGWETLQHWIRSSAAALQAFDPGHSAISDALQATQQETLDVVRSLHEQMAVISGAAAGDPGHGSSLERHLDLQIDTYRDLIDGGAPQTAFDLLTQLEAEVGEAASAAIRARIKGNLGWASLRLGEPVRAGELLIAAHTLNPSNRKLIANRVLGLILTGQPEEAARDAKAALAADPTNETVALYIFHLATLNPTRIDPVAVTPAPLLDDLGVRLHRINYHREHDAPEVWRQLAAETLERFPHDPDAQRMGAEGLLDAALTELNEAGAMSPAATAGLRQAAEMLQALWKRVRRYQHLEFSPFLPVGINLVVAYRALQDLDAATRVQTEVLQAAPDDEDVRASALSLAQEMGDLAAMRRHLVEMPEGRIKTIQRLNLCAQEDAWSELLAEATPARRGALEGPDLEAFDSLVCRARCALGGVEETPSLVSDLLETYPDSIGVHAFAADILAEVDAEAARQTVRRGREQLANDTPHGARHMLARAAYAVGDYDSVIAALDGAVALDRPSRELRVLLAAIASAPPRPRTREILDAIAPTLLEQPEYARFAGAAELARGELTRAERHFRAAAAGEPRELWSHHRLYEVLWRQNRDQEARAYILAIDEDAVSAEPEELMCLAHRLSDAGAQLRGLALGYRTTRAHRDDVRVVQAYPGLILGVDDLDLKIGPAGEGVWFRLERDGAPDVEGVIETGGVLSRGQYPPDHPLALALAGKRVDDEVVVPRELEDQRYRLAELKPKEVWLLHDIMATFGHQFPASQALHSFQLTEADGVASVLAVLRKLDEPERKAIELYRTEAIPLAALAAIRRRTAIDVAHAVAVAGVMIRTCSGERAEFVTAVATAEAARGQGAVLDTFTLLTAWRLDLLPALKAYFGRLVVPRLAVDTIIEMRDVRRTNLEREFLTISFIGDEPVREVYTPQDTARAVAAHDALLAAVEAVCEIRPNEGSDDLRLKVADLDPRLTSELLDPIHLALSLDLFFLSDDLPLREFAFQLGVRRGGWLQATCHAMASANAIDATVLLRTIGRLAAFRHGHLWLDTEILRGLWGLEGEDRLRLFRAAAEFVGGPLANPDNQTSMVCGFLLRTFEDEPAEAISGRAIDILLTRLLSGREDWRAILRRVLGVLRRGAAQHHPAATRGLNYVRAWIRGHFLASPEDEASDDA